MSRLNVELYGILLGTIADGKNGIDFATDDRVFEKYPVASTIMSLSVPLTPKFTAPQRKRCRNFFAELLPEGRNLRWLLQTLPPEERNTYGILRKYGKDVAGALLIYDPEDPASSKTIKAEKVDSKKIRYLLEHMPQEPLANSKVSGKTSLGGVQGKIVLARKGSSWYRTHYGYPSTHILKPAQADYPTMIYDEAFCMGLAYKLGLTKHPVWIENFDGVDALVIERYDRDRDIENGRIHQEDFNQALGAHGDEKYQEYGGKISAKRIAKTIDRFCAGDVKRFASQLIFAIAIGNLDMHAKNVSIFHLSDETVSLAPTYDQVPLRHQGSDGRMALAIDGEYVHANLSLRMIRNELLAWQTSSFTDERDTDMFVKEFLESCYSAVETLDVGEKTYPGLKKDITSHISNLLTGKRIT
jgi:serine/threonine-protein kinase HipA